MTCFEFNVNIYQEINMKEKTKLLEIQKKITEKMNHINVIHSEIYELTVIREALKRKIKEKGTS